jgi:hypothetical protein
MPTPKVNSWLGWRIFTVNRHRQHKHSISSSSAYLVQKNAKKSWNPFSWSVAKPVQSVIQRLTILKVFGESNSISNRKGEHSAKWNFPDWTQNYLPDWHVAAESITQVAPVGVSSHWKSQITVEMIRFGSLLASLFFISPFRGSGLRENYFWL